MKRKSENQISGAFYFIEKGMLSQSERRDMLFKIGKSAEDGGAFFLSGNCGRRIFYAQDWRGALCALRSRRRSNGAASGTS